MVYGCRYIGGFVTPAYWLGPKFGSRLALCCIHHELWEWFCHDDITVNIVMIIQ